MKKIYIVVSNSGSYVSKLLKLVTREKYVHVGIAVSADLEYLYSFGRKYLYTPLPGGFVEENLKKQSKYFRNSIIKIYELNITEKQYKKLISDLNNNYILLKEKYRYNILGLPLIQFNKIYHRKYHFVCSQFCGKLLMDNNILTFNKDYSIIKPEDFLHNEQLKEIFEGKIIDYFHKMQ